MKRFLMLVGVAVVAAAVYVAASPASQQSKTPTLKQFNALKKQVTSLNKSLKTVTTLAKTEATLLGDCDQVAVPIDQFGDGSAAPTQGYEYSLDATPDNATVMTTALDVTDPTTDTGALFITGGDSSCGSLFAGHELQRAAAKAGVQFSHASHLPSFSAHGR